MIVVAGESLIDLIVGADGRVEAIPGGGPYNVARTLGRLGQAVAFLGRMSTDRFGSVLRAGLAAEDVDLGLVPMTDAPTLLAVAELDAGGAATYHFYAAGTAAPGLIPADVPDGLPASTSAETRANYQAILDSAKRQSNAARAASGQAVLYSDN